MRSEYEVFCKGSTPYICVMFLAGRRYLCEKYCPTTWKSESAQKRKVIDFWNTCAMNLDSSIENSDEDCSKFKLFLLWPSSCLHYTWLKYYVCHNEIINCGHRD
jgi:hypothetical protein